MGDLDALFPVRVLQVVNESGGFLQTVSHDGTLTGNGTVASPLAVVSGGAAVPVLAVSASVTNASVAPISPSWPVPPPSPGCLAVVAMVSSAGGYSSPGVPPGWLPVAGLPQVTTSASANWHLTLWWKILDASDIGVDTGSWGGGGTVLAAALGIFDTGSGASKTGGWSRTLDLATSDTQNGSNVVIPPALARFPNTLIIAAASSAGTGTVITTPTGYTDIANVSGVGGTNFPLWMGYQLAQPGTQIAAASGAIAGGPLAWGASRVGFSSS